MVTSCGELTRDNEIMNESGRNEFSPSGDRVRSSGYNHCSFTEQAPTGRLPLEVYRIHQTGKRLSGRPSHGGTACPIRPKEHLGIPPLGPDLG